METEDTPQSIRKKADEAVTYLYVTFINFSAAARKEPREAWRLLFFLAQSKADSQQLHPLDIFCPESQLPVYREALQQFVIDTPHPLTEAAELRQDFLFSLWNDVQNPIGPPPSKFKNLQWIVKQDLLEFNLLSGQIDHRL